MPSRVEPGRFLGRTIRKRHVGDLMLADVRYPPRARLPRHEHERAYFCLILSGNYGEGYVRRTRVCEPMMVVFHPPGEQHAETMGDTPVVSFNVELGPEWLQHMCDCGLPFDQPVERRGGPAVELASRLFRELFSAEPGSLLTIESLTADILLALSPPAARNDAGMPSWLRGAPDLIEAHLQKPPALRTLASAAGVHPVHFAAAFRRFYGCSPGEYARRRRIDFARKQIANPELPLARIALDVGFADQSHLTRVFKRFTGFTPREYRTFLAFKTD